MTPRRTRRRLLPSKGWTLVITAVLLLVLLQLLVPTDESRPYDPDSYKPDGTKGFVMLMEQAGARVEQAAYPSGRTAVLLDDSLTQSETDRVEEWIADGGTLIVSDVRSSFQRSVVSFSGEKPPSQLRPACNLLGVRDVQAIEPDRHDEYYEFRPDPEASSCFPANTGYFLQVHRSGQGRIIELGGSDIFTNNRLDEADNSVLLANLVQPSAENSLTILETRDARSVESTGDATLTDLISPRVKQAAWMLVITTLLFMYWRGRRLGKPVEERSLVRIPASQLTIATGDLLQTADKVDAAADMLRHDLRRTLCDLVGLRVDAPTESIADLAAHRLGVERNQVLHLLSATRITDARALVTFAQQVEALHREATHVR